MHNNILNRDILHTDNLVIVLTIYILAHDLYLIGNLV